MVVNAETETQSAWLQSSRPSASAATTLAVDEERERARGRELASQAVDELIAELWRRAAGHQLDRGLRLSLPYYDGRRLSLCWRDFTVIPRGRIFFVPAFVVIAAGREIERVRCEARLDEETRAHLVSLLERLQSAFSKPLV
jgi:hypothetical protein